MWPSNSRQNHPRNYFTISRSSLSRCFLSFFWVLAIVSASRANTNDKASFFGVFCIVRTTKTSSSFTCFDVDLWVLSWWFAVALMLISSCCDIDWCFWDSKYGRILSWGFKFVFADLSVFFVWHICSTRMMFTCLGTSMHCLSFFLDGNQLCPNILKQHWQWDDNFPWLDSNVFSLYRVLFNSLTWQCQSLLCFSMYTCCAGRSYHPTHHLKVLGLPLRASKRAQHTRADCHWIEVEKGAVFRNQGPRDMMKFVNGTP